MPVQTLRNEIETLNREIAEWRGEIELIEDRIEAAYAEISDKEAEIERIEAETAAMDELRQIVNGGEILGRDPAEIRAIIDFIRNGATSTPDTEVLHNLSNTRTVVINTETGEETEITPEMESGYITIVGTSHQALWEIEHYTPEIGELVRLDKQTERGNCWGRLIGHCNDEGEDVAIGVLPTETGDKPAELAEVNLPCKTHQEMWREHRDELELTYEVVGAVPGKYVVIKPHIPDEEPQSVEEPEEFEMYRIENPEPAEEIENIEDTIAGIAATVEEARRLFIAAMPDTCTIINPIEDCGDYFKINYLNHRMNNDPFCEAKVNKQ